MSTSVVTVASPETTVTVSGDTVTVNSTTGTAVQSLVDLSDVEISTLTGNAMKVVAVNADEDAFELQAAGAGDMLKATYDPDNVGADVFDTANQKLNGMGEIGEALADSDEVLLYNASGSVNKKSLLSRVWTYIQGKLSGVYQLVLSEGAFVDGDKTKLDGIANGATANVGDMTKAVYDPNGDGVIDVAQGGTGATTANGARTALGLAIGSDVQAHDANLDSIAGLVPDSKMIIGNGLGGFEMAAATDVRTFINVENGAEANNISDVNATDLTDGGATTLHKHDHGGMDGLGDDDHSQYHNDTRGDARYLYRENTTPFTPDGDYEPATKKYVDDNAGGGGGYNETFYPVISYPDTYGNLSGKTGRWTASGSGTNEYYYTFDVPEPTDILYDGSSATQGTVGSLTDHQWDYGDNDSLGYNTIYGRDDSGDPDGLAVNLWMADWWGVEGATPAFGDEEDVDFPVHLDNSTDQGFVCQFKTLPADVTTWTMKFWARSSDRSSSGTITIRALDRAIQTNGADKPTATTLATATFSLTADGSIVTISGTTANLDATTGEIPQVCIIRDVSEDAIATPMTVDLSTVEVQYAVA